MHLAINAWFWDNPAVGSGQYLRYLLPALFEAASDIEITLVSCNPIPHTETVSPRLKTFVAPTIFSNQRSHLAKIWFEQITFPRVCRHLQVDVAHVPYFGSPLYPTDPTVVTVHDLIPMVLPTYRGKLTVRMYTALVAAAARQANFIMADSDASRQDILTRLNMPDERVQTVYLAQAPMFNQPQTADDIEAIRHKYNLPERFVLYLGGYDVRKNVSMLLRAYALLEESLRQTYPLILAGRLPQANTPFFPNVLKLAEELGLPDHLLTPGWIDEADKPALYAAASLFVYPSRYEGFGLPVLEGMACGTPVITTHAASLPELAGEAAYLVQPDDSTQLAAAMRHLCQQPDLRQQMVEQGRTQAEKFNWAETARQTLQIYRNVLR